MVTSLIFISRITLIRLTKVKREETLEKYPRCLVINFVSKTRLVCCFCPATNSISKRRRRRRRRFSVFEEFLLHQIKFYRVKFQGRAFHAKHARGWRNQTGDKDGQQLEARGGIFIVAEAIPREPRKKVSGASKKERRGSSFRLRKTFFPSPPVFSFFFFFFTIRSSRAEKLLEIPREFVSMRVQSFSSRVKNKSFRQSSQGVLTVLTTKMQSLLQRKLEFHNVFRRGEEKSRGKKQLESIGR